MHIYEKTYLSNNCGKREILSAIRNTGGVDGGRGTIKADGYGGSAIGGFKSCRCTNAETIVVVFVLEGVVSRNWG